MKYRDLVIFVLVIALFVLAFFVLKPVFMAIIYGLLLAYISRPIYKILNKKIKNEFISTSIVCFGLFLIIILILAVIIGVLFNQVLNLYFSLKGADFTPALSQLISKLGIASPDISSSIIDNIKSATSNLIVKFLDSFNGFILNLPSLALRLVVVIFVYFYALKDGDKMLNYLKSVSPLKKENEEKFFQKFKDVTNSVILGQIVVGIIQGGVAGIGYFIFGVDHALIFTILSIGASIIPVVGPWVIWVPVNFYIFATGRPEIAIGFLLYNIFITSWIDNVTRPLFISKKTQLNSAIVVVGMIGGFFVFGIVGLIIGPLILAYILLILEIYKKNHSELKENI